MSPTRFLCASQQVDEEGKLIIYKVYITLLLLSVIEHKRIVNTDEWSHKSMEPLLRATWLVLPIVSELCYYQRCWINAVVLQIPCWVKQSQGKHCESEWSHMDVRVSGSLCSETRLAGFPPCFQLSLRAQVSWVVMNLCCVCVFFWSWEKIATLYPRCFE